MNQRVLIRRLFTMSWLLLVLLFGFFLTTTNASNRERSGQHNQQLGRSHHHRRNSSNSSSSSLAAKNSAGKSGMKRNVETTTTSVTNSPYLMAVEESKKTMIAVQASLNGNIFMHCPVDLAEDFQVSWVRLPDWRIVASGRHIYNKDERFRVLHAEGTGEWTLQIKYAALIDQGLYECQVSTGTGIMIYYYNVSVVVPSTSIVGGSEYHVDKGSAIQLTCIIRNIPQEPQFIFWYHNDRMINYDSSADGGTAGAETSSDGAVGGSSSSTKNGSRARTRTRPRVEVVTEIDSNLMMDDSYVHQPDDQRDGSGSDRTVTSQLTIRDVTDADSGNYTCSPSNAEPASTMVYVSEGDDAAAAIQVSVGETTNVSDVASSAASAVSAASLPTASSSRTTSASLAVLVLSCLTMANRHIHRR